MAGFRERAEAKGLELAVDTVGPPPEKLHTDPRRVKQILWNLVDNATRRMARLLGGDLLVDHSDDQGSTFLLTLSVGSPDHSSNVVQGG